MVDTMGEDVFKVGATSFRPLQESLERACKSHAQMRLAALKEKPPDSASELQDITNLLQSASIMCPLDTEYSEWRNFWMVSMSGS